jgi:hypothetical protein
MRHLTTLIRHPQETLILCIVSALDVIMTRHLLTRADIGFTESNPFARYFLDRWGLAGMAYFKAGMTIFVCLLTQIIARKNSELAKNVLGLATLIIIGVVIYSVWMHFHHRGIVEVIEEAMISAINEMVLAASMQTVPMQTIFPPEL